MSRAKHACVELIAAMRRGRDSETWCDTAQRDAKWMS